MKRSYGVAAALAILAAATLPGGVAKAAPPIIASQAQIFDARADGAASTYCIDAPAVLVGQQICGGFLSSAVTATSDPRGFGLAGLAPVPKASSIPLIIPSNVQGVPVPEQVQAGLKQIDFTNIPSQCQVTFPELTPGDADKTCGGPTFGDTALGFIGSGANAHVYSTGDQSNPTQTRTVGDVRASRADLPGLQATFDNVRSVTESGLNEDGLPIGDARMNAGRVSIAGGLFLVDDIVSTTEIAYAGTKETTAASTAFTYGAASFAGIPVEITPGGLVLATDKVPAEQVGALTQQLNTALANNNGFGVKLLPAPPTSVQDGFVRARSGGIQVSYRGTTGTDVVYTQTLGITLAQVSAVAATGTSGTTTTGTTAAGTATGSAPAAGAATGSAPAVAAGAATGSAATDAGLGTAGVDTAGPGAEFGVGAAPAQGGSDPGLGASTTPGPATQTLRAVGDQALLTGGLPTTVQTLSPSRMEAIYPIFCLLLLATLAVARFRRVPFTKAG